jgi:S-formylglutathione hydrolase FrmB
MRPTIEVMPFGSTSTFVDKQWANGYQPNEGWETFVARDLVRAIDSRFRTIRSGSARAIGGLSSGGYGAINIALHHPGEFRVVESWSGYERAENIAPIFGGQAARLAYNSPLDYLPHVAARLRAAGVRFWFYTGIHDAPHLRAQNRLFAAELTRLGILHRSIVVRGGHNWRVWRAMGPAALVYASRHLAHR